MGFASVAQCLVYRAVLLFRYRPEIRDRHREAFAAAILLGGVLTSDAKIDFWKLENDHFRLKNGWRLEEIIIFGIFLEIVINLLEKRYVGIYPENWVADVS